MAWLWSNRTPAHVNLTEHPTEKRRGKVVDKRTDIWRLSIRSIIADSSVPTCVRWAAGARDLRPDRRHPSLNSVKPVRSHSRRVTAHYAVTSNRNRTASEPFASLSG